MWGMPSNRVESRRAVHEHNRVILRPWEKIIVPFVLPFVRRRARVDLRFHITQNTDTPNKEASQPHHKKTPPRKIDGKKKGRTHCPKSSSNLFASSDVKCTSVPFSACSFRSSLRVRLPARPPRCECVSGVGTSGSEAAVPPWEGNTTRFVVVGAFVEEVTEEEESTIDSG